MPDSDPDDSLLTLARQGDREAMGRLFQRHETLVYQTCWRILKQPEDAAECAQDTLVKAISHLRSFDSRSAFSTWLTRIAMNEALTKIRRRSIRRTASLDVSANDDAGSWGSQIADPREPDPSQRVEQEETLTRLRSALARLPEDQRQLIQMRDLQEMDCETIARRLGIPAGTLKSRLFRARLALRQLIVASDPTASSTP